MGHGDPTVSQTSSKSQPTITRDTSLTDFVSWPIGTTKSPTSNSHPNPVADTFSIFPMTVTIELCKMTGEHMQKAGP